MYEPPRADRTASDSPTGRRKPGLLVGLLVGLVAGAGGASLVVVLLGGAGEGSPQEDARTACRMLSQADLDAVEDGGTAALVALHRWGASIELAMAAAEADDQYQPLADTLTRAREWAGMTFAYDGKKVDAEIHKALEFCADV